MTIKFQLDPTLTDHAVEFDMEDGTVEIMTMEHGQQEYADKFLFLQPEIKRIRYGEKAWKKQRIKTKGRY